MAERKPIETIRSKAQDEAKSLGMDVKGMSTRDIKEAVKERKEADTEMAKFINKVLDSRNPDKGAAPADAKVVQNRTPEDKVGLERKNKRGGGGEDGGNGTPVEFYCYKDGQYGYVTLSAIAGFEPL